MTMLLLIKSFYQRLIQKWIYIVKNLILYSSSICGFSGAKNIGISPSGNNLLQLNKNYPLGHKGTIIELPKDNIIFKYVKLRGTWELEESKFLARGLQKAEGIKFKVAFLDIGANTGLVALQVINISGSNAEIFLFEPVPRHAFAISQNLKSLTNTHLNEFALSDKNGEAEIFTDTLNHGNTSLFNSAAPFAKIKTQIKLVDTLEYCNNFLKTFDSFVIKSDTQGMDALILSRIPNWIWQKCECAVIEVWALPEINKKHVEDLLVKIQKFEFVGWTPKSQKKIAFHEISEFWLNKSGAQRNLFLS
jgi:FkbM family methyltransferase